jgi:hypothetical protein
VGQSKSTEDVFDELLYIYDTVSLGERFGSSGINYTTVSILVEAHPCCPYVQ